MAIRVQVAGVGGHGVILVARVLSQAAMDAGRHAVMSEVHGMSQKGGVVQSTLVIDGGDVPMVSAGKTDLLIASEAGEALRNGALVKRGGTLVLNKLTVVPPHMVTGHQAYLSVDFVTDWFLQHGVNVWLVDGLDIANTMHNPKVMNAAMLGALAKSGALPFGFDGIKDALIKVTKGRFTETNVEAMQRGYETVRRLGD